MFLYTTIYENEKFVKPTSWNRKEKEMLLPENDNQILKLTNDFYMPNQTHLIQKYWKREK